MAGSSCAPGRLLRLVLDRIVVRQQFAGVARRNEHVKLVVRHVAPGYELLDASTTNRLTGVKVVFRVCRDGMQEREFASLVAGPAEAGEDPLAGHGGSSAACKGSYTVEDPQDFVAAIRLEHQLLILVS